jgi:transcriptional regulator with XRE-family HTH domain
MLSKRVLVTIRTEEDEVMPEQLTGSTVPRRQLGRYLRDLRNKAGLTAKTAAAQLERSEPTIWRIETGQTSVRSIDVQLMCELYGATAEVTEALKALAKETKAKGWWQAYGDAVSEGFDLYVGLEEAASLIFDYQQELVPGLFQTENYARAIFKSGLPGMSDAEIERRVRFRLARQAIVRRVIDPPTLRVALNESALRHPVGGREVMAAQLKQLAQASELPNVSLRVVPLSAGLHPGMQSGSFTIFRFPLNGGGQENEPPTVHAGLYTGSIYLDKPGEIERHSEAFAGIWQNALDEPSSRALMRQTAEAIRNG